MTASACIAAFDDYSQRLVESVRSRDEVVGLVLVGSGADRSRIDEWSDHDFFLVTVDDAAAGFRENLDWLPDHDKIVLSVRETEHGLKVVYDDGHVLEFAVATMNEIADWAANKWTVLFDRGVLAEPIAQTMSAVAAKPKPGDEVDDGRDIRLFVSLLLIGTGRARRGELLTAGQFSRSYAVRYLLAVFAHRVPSVHAEKLDDLDVYRRFEQVYPDAGAQLARILEQDPETAARQLLDFAEQHLATGWDEWPARAVDAVRRRLAWRTAA